MDHLEAGEEEGVEEQEDPYGEATVEDTDGFAKENAPITDSGGEE